MLFTSYDSNKLDTYGTMITIILLLAAICAFQYVQELVKSHNLKSIKKSEDLTALEKMYENS